jgi:hypothetical protein
MRIAENEWMEVMEFKSLSDPRWLLFEDGRRPGIPRGMVGRTIRQWAWQIIGNFAVEYRIAVGPTAEIVMAQNPLSYFDPDIRMPDTVRGTIFVRKPNTAGRIDVAARQFYRDIKRSLIKRAITIIIRTKKEQGKVAMASEGINRVRELIVQTAEGELSTAGEIPIGISTHNWRGRRIEFAELRVAARKTEDGQVKADTDFEDELAEIIGFFKEWKLQLQVSKADSFEVDKPRFQYLD